MIILLPGLILAFAENLPHSCTEKGCFPIVEDSESGECDNIKIPCNTCYKGNYLYYTGIINIGQECKGSEILEYNISKTKSGEIKDIERVDRTIEWEECSYFKLELFK